ncbi:MAG: amidohydrolase family protein [Planctomycetota bacterium]
MRGLRTTAFLALTTATLHPSVDAQIAVRAETLYTMAGDPISDGVVLVDAEGKITAVGPAATVDIPGGVRVLSAAVVTPGLIDSRSVVGLAGYLNQDGDSDQLDRSEPMQPELRALDAFDVREPLVDWIRSFGVTTVQTGHAPGALIPGQMMVVKTTGNTVEDAALIENSGIAVTLGDGANAPSGAPGTRAKATAMLRSLLLEAKRRLEKAADDEADLAPNLRLDAMVEVLRGERPLIVHAQRSRDLLTALRLREEFGFRLVLDGAAEAHLCLEEIAAARVPVIVHPPMARHRGQLENATFELASILDQREIPVAFQSGYEPYVPKTRVVLFEAGMAAAHGLGFDRTLEALTIDAARMLGLDERIGSLEVGKDGDFACYDGDPFEYTSHCTATVIEGVVVFEGSR